MVRPHVLLTYCLGESRRISDEEKLAALEQSLFEELEARAKYLREQGVARDADEFRGEPLEHKYSLGTALNNHVTIFVHGESDGPLGALENNFHGDDPSDAVRTRRDEVYAALAARLNERMCDGVKLDVPATRQELALVATRYMQREKQWRRSARPDW